MSRVKVYVAGPYSSDPERNTRAAIATGNILLDLGYAPFVPHAHNHMWALEYPRPYEEWIAFDLVWLRNCDIVLRIPGESPGADREVAEAKRVGIPVFTSLEEMYKYILTHL